MSVGKRFEYTLLKQLRHDYPGSYIERNVDRLYGRGNYSVKSPPDIIANTPCFDALIECKAVKGQSLPFNRLSLHQLHYLEQYHNISDRHLGLIAVLYYNGQRGKGRVHDAWLIPVTYWTQYESRYPRKSIARKHVEVELDDYRCYWSRGKWTLPKLPVSNVQW